MYRLDARLVKIVLLLACWLVGYQLCVVAQEKGRLSGKADSSATKAKVKSADQESAADKSKPMPEPRGLVRLAKDYDVWLDLKRKLVVVDGKVVLRRGLLEMFACPKGTKPHESVVAVNSKASFVHAGLLAVGAKVGTPVKFDPQYVSASGVEVKVLVLWIDKEGKKQKANAQQWVRNLKTGKALNYPWIFSGSGFWTDENSGQRYYHADAGDFICVSNFPTAMLDLPIKSSTDTTGLLFEALTENIPPVGTYVRLVLIPQLDEQKKSQQDKENLKKKQEKQQPSRSE